MALPCVALLSWLNLQGERRDNKPKMILSMPKGKGGVERTRIQQKINGVSQDIYASFVPEVV
jgi:hypothetical protein